MMRTARRRSAVAGVALGLGFVPLLSSAAQRPASRAPDDTTQRHDSVRTRLAPVRVSASIEPTAASSVGSGVPASLAVIARSDIDSRQARLVTDVLSLQPGVSLYDDLGTPWKLTLSTRGFSVGPTVGTPNGLSVFVDGVRQNEPDAQEVNFDLLPLEHVTRVELLSGTASLLGSNSLGGAINLVTERGVEQRSAALDVSGGSFGAYGTRGMLRGRATGDLDYYVGGGYGRERGWRDATAATTYDGFLNLDRTREDKSVSVQVFGARSRAETAGSLPESLFHVSPRTNFTPGDFEDLDLAQLAVSAHTPVGKGRLGLTLFARRSAAERFNVNQAPDPNVRSRTLSTSFGGTADWRRTLSIGRGLVDLRAGIDGVANRVRVRIYGEPADVAAAPADLTTDVRSPSMDLAGYALSDLRFGRLLLSGGARFDLARVPFRNGLRPNDNTLNNYHSAAPRFGASVELTRGASLYASVGRSFRAPAILELGCADPEATCPLPFALGDDPPLDPVRATTYEVGGRWASRWFVATASAYRTEVRDEIFFVASEAALLAGYFTNLDRTRREGVTLGVTGVAAGNRLTWFANYARTRATLQSPVQLFSIRADEDFADNPLAGENDVKPGARLPLVPDHQVNAGTLVRLGGGVSAGLDGRYVGRQWLRGDEANETTTLDAYVLADARVGYARAGWELMVTSTNVFDSHEAVFGTFNENRATGELERFLTPASGRAVKLLVRIPLVRQR